MIMRWFRFYRARRLIQAQETLLRRIKIAKLEETNCITRSVKYDDAGWLQNASQWRRRRREHVQRFLSTNHRIEELLRE